MKYFKVIKFLFHFTYVKNNRPSKFEFSSAHILYFPIVKNSFVFLHKTKNKIEILSQQNEHIPQYYLTTLHRQLSNDFPINTHTTFINTNLKMEFFICASHQCPEATLTFHLVDEQENVSHIRTENILWQSISQTVAREMLSNVGVRVKEGSILGLKEDMIFVFWFMLFNESATVRYNENFKSGIFWIQWTFSSASFYGWYKLIRWN